MGRRIVTSKQKDAAGISSSVYSTVSAADDQAAVTPSEPSVSEEKTASASALSSASLTAAPDDYISKLIKYIPAEVITLYLFVDGILNSFTASPVMNWVVFFLLLVLTPIYMWRMTQEASKSPAWDQIIVSFVSFALWVYVIGGPFEALSWYAPQYGSILVAIFTVFVPLIRK